MAKIDVLDILRSKKMSPLEFDFDNLMIPPIYCYLTQQDIESLRSIATSIRLSSKINQKYKMIDSIMTNRGFKRFSAGTNRVVYRFLEDDRFLVKVAVDKVGMQDNPMEYKNQFLLKPYVTKMFYTSGCGTVGFVERVLPIKNKGEFREVASDVFEILINKILGKYVVEDVGTKFFMNWGIRMGSGPVLLDYPYIYKLDGKKLFCTKTDPITNITCNGEIDYDNGFNHLVCSKCGKTYLATDLRDNSIDNKIIIKGGTQMRIVMKEGEEIVNVSIPTEEVIERPKKISKKSNKITIGINNGDGNIIIMGKNEANDKIESKKELQENNSESLSDNEYDENLEDSDNKIESVSYDHENNSESLSDNEYDENLEDSDNKIESVSCDQEKEDDEQKKEENIEKYVRSSFITPTIDNTDTIGVDKSGSSIFKQKSKFIPSR